MTQCSPELSWNSCPLETEEGEWESPVVIIFVSQAATVDLIGGRRT